MHIIIEGYKSGKQIIQMALLEDAIEAEQLRKSLRLQFPEISFTLTYTVYDRR